MSSDVRRTCCMTWSGLYSGCCVLTSAHTAAACGDDMEVPLSDAAELFGKVLQMLCPWAETSTVTPKFAVNALTSLKLTLVTDMTCGYADG